MVALVVSVVIGTRLAWQLLVAGRGHPYYGLVVGLVLATVISLFVGIVETPPLGIVAVGKETYYYVISPLGFLLGAMVVPLALFSDGWLRIVLGFLFVLFLPGYALIAALFPRKADLDGIVRLSLSLAKPKTLG